MVPRPDVVAIEADATIEDAISRAIGAGYSRLPCYQDTTDDIVGLVYLKDLVQQARAGAGLRPVRVAVRDAEYVPEQKRVAELLREMRTEKFHMAVVIDEHGGTAGIVTLEDLLEEIVGEITDEFDVEGPGIETLAGGGWRAPGRTPIDDLNDVVGRELPSTEWDTVGGLVFNLLGHVPEAGETVRFQGLEFRTERMNGRRITSVAIRPVDDPSNETEAVDRPVSESA
jgi:CBS domain containing-hemolysin-like protein